MPTTMLVSRRGAAGDVEHLDAERGEEDADRDHHDRDDQRRPAAAAGAGAASVAQVEAVGSGASSKCSSWGVCGACSSCSFGRRVRAGRAAVRAARRGAERRATGISERRSPVRQPARSYDAANAVINDARDSRASSYCRERNADDNSALTSVPSATRERAARAERRRRVARAARRAVRRRRCSQRSWRARCRARPRSGSVASATTRLVGERHDADDRGQPDVRGSEKSERISSSDSPLKVRPTAKAASAMATAVGLVCVEVAVLVQHAGDRRGEHGKEHAAGHEQHQDLTQPLSDGVSEAGSVSARGQARERQGTRRSPRRPRRCPAAACRCGTPCRESPGRRRRPGR